ncbi:MAG: HAMP domain-containing histidine kinase [Ruminococcus sp.]|nr:HAMP domain-containing histidine kinase [Ruminococcus sp.]
MRGFRRFFAVLAAAAVVFLLVLLSLSGTQRQERDMVLLNDIVQTVREHISQPEELSQLELGTELAVFSKTGQLIFASDKIPERLRTVSDAGREGYFCMAVTEGERFMGTVAVPDPVLSEYSTKQKRLMIMAAATVVIILGLLAAAGIFIRLRIVRPFRQMEHFAENIARGDLDHPLLKEKDELFGSFTESFDIMREELRSAREREDSLKLREKELAASLSHDVKTPVTGIKLICELLMCKTDDPYLREKISSIDQKADQIHLLADDILTSALEELGEMRVELRDQSSKILPKLLCEHDVRGLVKAENVPDCLICTDPGRLSQVIANIISNSYKYAGTQIRVSYGFQDSFLSMELSDLGGGVPEEELDLLTVKYYRGKSNSQGREGSGLGLYISGELMKRMKGSLSCSNTGEGLAVTLLIPLS